MSAKIIFVPEITFSCWFKNLFLNDYAVNPKEIDYVYNVLEICTCHD